MKAPRTVGEVRTVGEMKEALNKYSDDLVIFGFDGSDSDLDCSVSFSIGVAEDKNGRTIKGAPECLLVIIEHR